MMLLYTSSPQAEGVATDFARVYIQPLVLRVRSRSCCLENPLQDFHAFCVHFPVSLHVEKLGPGDSRSYVWYLVGLS